MLFYRYGGAAHEVLSLEFDDFIDQINFIIDEKAEENVRERWLNGYQNLSLGEFKKAIGYKKPSETIVYYKPIDDVLDDLLLKFG